MKRTFLPEIETLPASEIKQFQEKALPGLLDYLDRNSVFYRRLFKEHSIDPASILKLDDLERIPVTDKSHLQKFNRDFICVPDSKIVDYITTSGTMGDPVTQVMTDSDLERLAYNEAVSMTCAEGRPGDIYQLMTTMDKRFMAGLAYFLGARKMGAAIVRVGSGIPELQWDTIARIRPNAIIAVPSFILRLIDYAEKHGIDYRSSSIRKAYCIGEPLRNQDFTLNALGRRITEKWPIQLYSTYASTEMATTFSECAAGQGGHHHPELIIAEFLDDNDRPVKEGEAGELTITTLGVEGMPLLRFKTGDVCCHYKEPCKCGRTSMRLGPVIGRRQQMIKFKGTSLYPPSLFDILDNISNIESYVVEVRLNDVGMDDVILHVSRPDGQTDLEHEIKDHFRAKLRVVPAVNFMSADELFRLQFPEGTRKAVRFIDNRNLDSIRT